jgi:peptidoglycan-associated lipoprotein
MQRIASILGLGALAAATTMGCAHKPQTKPAEQTTASEPSAGTTSAAGTPEKLCSGDMDCGPKQLCIRQHCVDITAGMAECGALRVHFELDSAEIVPADRSLLERPARCLKAAHSLHVTVEGNADERGTEEYNLALGDRRATSVAKYLESLGVSQEQLKTVSYGKENPLCTEHDEACWAKNRRAAVKPQEAAAKPATPAKKKH